MLAGGLCAAVQSKMKFKDEFLTIPENGGADGVHALEFLFGNRPLLGCATWVPLVSHYYVTGGLWLESFVPEPSMKLTLAGENIAMLISLFTNVL